MSTSVYNPANILQNSIKFHIPVTKSNVYSSRVLYSPMNTSTNFNQQTNYTNFQTNPNYGYVFRERYGKLNWKEVIRIDLDSMIRNNDITPLEDHMENLVFSNVDEYDMEIVPEGFAVKLVRTLQYIIEYLMFSQQKVEIESRNMETQYNFTITEMNTKDLKIKEYRNTIKELKKEVNQLDLNLKTYQVIVEDLRGGVLPGGRKDYYFCKYCDGKKFSSQDKVNEHISRRHALQESQEMMLKNSLRQSMEKDKLNILLNEMQVEKKLEGLRFYLENFMKNTNRNDGVFQLLEHQRELEARLNSLDKSKGNPDFEKQMREMKELLLTLKPKDNNENIEKALSQIKEDNEEKNKHLTQEISFIKDSFLDEIKKLKERKTAPSFQRLETVSNLTFSPKVKPKEKVKSPTPPKKVTPPPSTEPTPKRYIINKKHFCAGDLESDYTEDEEVVVPKKEGTPPPKQKTPPKTPQKPIELVVDSPVKQQEPEIVKEEKPVEEDIHVPIAKPKTNDDFRMLNKLARSIIVRDDRFSKSKEKRVNSFKKIKLPEKVEADKSLEIEQMVNRKLKQISSKLGKEDLSSKSDLLYIVRDLQGDLKNKSVDSFRESVYVRPILDKLDLEDGFKLANMITFDTSSNTHAAHTNKKHGNIAVRTTTKKTSHHEKKESKSSAANSELYEKLKKNKLEYRVEINKKINLGDNDDDILGN